MPDIPELAQKFKGTYDLAGLGEAIYRSEVGKTFRWTDEGNDLCEAATLNQFNAVSRMCCYEFVHFVAYLTSEQITSDRGVPRLAPHDGSAYTFRSYSVWDRKTDIPRGKVVAGVAKSGNNRSGYYHIGISLGNHQVLNLTSSVNLNIARPGDVFRSSDYPEVRVADYHWSKAQNVPGPAAAPVAPVASPAVAAVGSPGRSK